MNQTRARFVWLVPMAVVSLQLCILSCGKDPHESSRTALAQASGGLGEDEVILISTDREVGHSTTNHIDFPIWLRNALPQYREIKTQATVGGWNVEVVSGGVRASLEIRRSYRPAEIDGTIATYEVVTVWPGGGDLTLTTNSSQSVVRFLLTSSRFRAGKAKLIRSPERPLLAAYPPQVFLWIQRPSSEMPP